MLLTILTVDARISNGDYYHFMNVDRSIPQQAKFTRYTDLMRGRMLIESGILENLRFYGWGKFAEAQNLQPGQNPSDGCSYEDRSDDPVMDLIIQLFPSVGPGLNANGAGSFYEMISNLIDEKAPNREDQIDEKITSMISSFFRIAREVRSSEAPANHEIFKSSNDKAGDKELVEKYFGEAYPTKRIQGKEKLVKALARVARNIARSVLWEDLTQKRLSSPVSLKFPDFFVNDLISAYAVEAMSPNKMAKLALNVSDPQLDRRALEFKLGYLTDLKEQNQTSIQECYGELYAQLGGKEVFEAREKEYKKLQERDRELDEQEGILFFPPNGTEPMSEEDRDKRLGEISNEKQSIFQQLKGEKFKYRESGIYQISLTILKFEQDRLDAECQTIQRYLEEKGYTSPLAEEFHAKIANSFSPFYPGGGTIELSRSVYEEGGKSYSYMDCAETALRQFLSVFIGTGFGENFKLAEDRIGSGLLKKFFSENKMDITQFATDCSQSTRNKIAQLMCGHKAQGIKYAREWAGPSDTQGYELRAGLDNLVKVFCLLLDGYQGNPEAADRIIKVNKKACSGDEAYFQNPDNIQAIFQDLAKIRTDTYLELEFIDLRFLEGRIQGTIKITFPNTKDDTVLILRCTSHHAEFKTEQQQLGYNRDEAFKPIAALYEIKGSVETPDNPLYILKLLKISRDSGEELNESERLAIDAAKIGLYEKEAGGIARLCTRTANPIDLLQLCSKIDRTIESIEGETWLYKGKEEQKQIHISHLTDIKKKLPFEVFDNLLSINPAQPERKEVLFSSIIFMKLRDTERFNREKSELIKKFEEKMGQYSAADIFAAEHFLFGEGNSELLKDVMVAHPEDLLDIFENEIYKQCITYRDFLFERPNYLPIQILTEKIVPYAEAITTSEKWSQLMRVLSMFDLEQLNPEDYEAIRKIVKSDQHFGRFSVPLYRLMWKSTPRNLNVLFPACYLTRNNLYNNEDSREITMEEIFGRDYRKDGIRIFSDILPSILTTKNSKLIEELFEMTDFTKDSYLILLGDLDNMIKKGILTQSGFEWKNLFKELVKKAKTLPNTEELIEKLKQLNVRGYYDEAKTQPDMLVSEEIFQ